MSTMTDLASWLLEQIIEDEQIAQEVADAMPRVPDPGGWFAGDELGIPSVGMGSVRAFAECAAKRLIIRYELAHDQHGDGHGPFVLALLALPYAERPGYREEWRPFPRADHQKIDAAVAAALTHDAEDASRSHGFPGLPPRR